MLIIGLISGTSADGTAAAAVRIEGAPPTLKWELLAHINVPHPPDLREQIFASFRPETGTVDRLCVLNFALGRAFADAAFQVAAAAGLTLEQVDLIGSHGQTVWHIPAGPAASTLQLGEAAVIAELTGLPVVSNFRTRDMAAGGQGAPLVSYVDRLLFSHPTRARALQNIGGIANVTYLPPLPPPSPDDVGQERGAGGVRSFDTGPGNMLMDYAAGRATNDAWEYDRDGVLAAQGRVDEALLAGLMAEPYLRQPAPKTTGRELFGVQLGARVWERAKAAGLAGVDILATLTAFTAASIAQAYRELLPAMPHEVIVSGGGARNPTLMAMLRASLGDHAPTPLPPSLRGKGGTLPPLLPGEGGGGVRFVAASGGVTVLTTDDFGLPAEAKEAVAFAVLAHETWHGRPGNLPAATGAQRAVVLGNITPGDEGRTTKDEGRNPESLVPSPQFPLTELRNPATENIDTLSTLDMVRLINAEDACVATAVGVELPAVAEAIDRIAERMARGGRLIYVGAGTSGRLAVLDAVECPPTFGARPEQVVALIAGGAKAITQAVEGAEDDALAGERDVAALNLSELDSVVGVAASGRTPYVLGALQEARRRGALVISLACNRPSPMEELADIAIALLTGPEVITGSTRLKAGTAQKLVLNMLSTGVMIRLGKTYGNLMVDVQATNAKLRVRARRIVEQATGLSPEEAAALLQACGGEVKVAIVATLGGVSPDEARRRLAVVRGAVRGALSVERETSNVKRQA